MRTRTRTIAASAAALALSAGVIVPALAQDGGDAATDETTVDQRATERHAAFAEALAEELDLDVDRVTEALENVHGRLHAERATARRTALADRLDAAVEDGELTREQADAILDADEAGVLGRSRHAPGGHRGHGGRGAGPGGDGPRFGDADA